MVARNRMRIEGQANEIDAFQGDKVMTGKMTKMEAGFVAAVPLIEENK